MPVLDRHRHVLVMGQEGPIRGGCLRLGHSLKMPQLFGSVVEQAHQFQSAERFRWRGIGASGGNAGAQSAMLMVRALGTGDVKVSDWLKLLGKELLVAGFLGLTMGVGVYLIGFMRGGMEIGIIVAGSMFAIVITGSLIGMTLPFIFTKFKKDPATASGPLVTSLADICGVLIYFSIAKLCLGI